MNILERLTNYIKLSHLELKKVVWPSKKEIIQHTMLVVGISLGVAAFLGVIDYILNIALGFII